MMAMETSQGEGLNESLTQTFDDAPPRRRWHLVCGPLIYGVLFASFLYSVRFRPADASQRPAREDTGPQTLVGTESIAETHETQEIQQPESPGMEALRLSCGGDGSATGEPPKIIGQWTTWTQTKSEVVRVKLWGAGGMGGAPVSWNEHNTTALIRLWRVLLDMKSVAAKARLVPEGGCQARRLRGRGRGRRGGYKGLGTRADLNNHANQMNPNNWRYWSSRGLQPPWRGGAVTGYNAAYPADTPVGIGVPYRPRQPEQTTQQQTQPTPERTKQARSVRLQRAGVVARIREGFVVKNSGRNTGVIAFEHTYHPSPPPKKKKQTIKRSQNGSDNPDNPWNHP